MYTSFFLNMPWGFYSLKAHCLAENHLLLFLAAQGQRLPVTTGVRTLDPQIPSLIPWYAVYNAYSNKYQEKFENIFNDERAKPILTKLTIKKYSTKVLKLFLEKVVLSVTCSLDSRHIVSSFGKRCIISEKN